MQTMTTFYRDVSECSDNELLELCRQCMFARQYGYFEPKSTMHKYMCDIICSESQRRCGSTVMLDMIITVGNELMKRYVEKNATENLPQFTASESDHQITSVCYNDDNA